MSWKAEWKPLFWIVGAFAILYLLPIENVRFRTAVVEALALARWYAREHVILCLLPAFFIAGGISVFLKQESVMHYLGPHASKGVAYTVAAVSGSILAVCSCTVLPLFAGIYTMGAGLGPATAFLYSGPAINVLAIILTARVLGAGLGTARALGAIVFSIVIGLVMARLFRKDEHQRQAPAVHPSTGPARPLYRTVLFFTMMVGILVFANWAKPDADAGAWFLLFQWKWPITSLFAAGLGLLLVRWFNVKPWKLMITALAVAGTYLLVPTAPELPFLTGIIGLSFAGFTTGGEMVEWLDSTWTFTKQILPLLLIGVLIAGLALGSPGHEGIVPSAWVVSMVGDNGFGANLFASVAGAFMYFATLTEVPILEGLVTNGMHTGPALALLLAGPALSLPNMLVIRSVMGTRKTLVFISLVIVMSTGAGLIFGWFHMQ